VDSSSNQARRTWAITSSGAAARAASALAKGLPAKQRNSWFARSNRSNACALQPDKG
jgi:hypothetical protein